MKTQNMHTAVVQVDMKKGATQGERRPMPVSRKLMLSMLLKRVLLFLSVFGPATITAMADNDAAGVATYSIAGAKLGYPILFTLVIITVLLGIRPPLLPIAGPLLPRRGPP